MAEGLLDGMLGGEAADTPASGRVGPEALVAAVAADVANQNPEVALKTAALFDKQIEVLEVQRRSLETEHEYFETEWGPRLLSLRLRSGLQIFVALFASVIGVSVAFLIYNAVTSRSMVIDAFEAPAALAASGISGKVVAAGLLDVLTRIQSENQTYAEHRSLSNAWTSDVTLEVPETGISIGELERFLKTRFGHDLHVDGDLRQTEKGGLALTVRGTGILAKTFSDEGRSLDTLLTEGGEYVYGQAQPGLWAAYLSSSRYEEAIHFCEKAYLKANSGERPYILNAWANAILAIGGKNAAHEALPLYKEAVRLKSDYWAAYNNIMLALNTNGDEEGVVRVAKQLMEAAGGRPGRAPETYYQNYDGEVNDFTAMLSSELSDLESHGGIGTGGANNGSENLQIAQVEVQLHDIEAAALRLRVTVFDQKSAPDVAAASLARAQLAEETSDLNTAAKEWDALSTAYAEPIVSTANPQLICYAALTYEKTGQAAKAEAALNAVGELRFTDCYRIRGDLLDLRGDWAGAQEWFAKAARLAPSIPTSYYWWGVALAKHGALVDATEKLKLAHQKGPHWADPLKAWGDVLVKQGKNRQALAKYDEASVYAPNWRQLNEARASLQSNK